MWKTYSYPSFSGGLATRSSRPNECTQFDNLDVDRDGYARCRLPSYLLNTVGALGSGLCVGVGKTVCPTGTPDKVIIAKDGLTFYYTAVRAANAPANSQPPFGSMPLTFSYFTVPASPDGSPVYFETMLDSTYYPKVYMACENFSQIVKWDGTSATASYCTGSPSNPILCCAFQQQLVVVSKSLPNVVYFSDTADPESWPSSNKFQIDAKYGPIVAMAAQDTNLYVFTADAILYITGALSSPYVGVMHPYISCVSQSCVSAMGTNIVFMSKDNNYYTLSGSLSLISDSIRGSLFGGYPIRATVGTAWTALTPSFFFVRAPQSNPSLGATVSTPATTAYPNFLLGYERQRYGYWGRYTYPITSGPGASIPRQCVVSYVEDWGSLLLPDGAGDVYIQPLMDSYFTDPVGVFPNMSPQSDPGIGSAPVVPVRSVVATSILDPENDPTMTYLFRKGRAYGSGSNITLATSMYVGASQAETPTVTLTPTPSATTLPCQWNLPGIDGSINSSPLEFNRVQNTISGNGLVLMRLEYDYSQQRRNLLSYS